MLTDAEKLAVEWGVPLVVAIIAVAIRIMLSPDRLSFFGVIRGLLVGLLIGFLGATYLADVEDLSYQEVGAIIGMTAIFAEDILVGLLKLARMFREDPASVLRIFTGRK